MKEFLVALRAHLRAKEEGFTYCDPWGAGNSEDGFTETQSFDFDGLLDEIDVFSGTFNKEGL